MTKRASAVGVTSAAVVRVASYVFQPEASAGICRGGVSGFAVGGLERNCQGSLEIVGSLHGEGGFVSGSGTDRKTPVAVVDEREGLIGCER